MNKEEFLKGLNESLKKLPDAERKEAVSFYDEMLTDKIESGQSENEAVASLGDIKLLSQYITAEKIESNMKEKKPKKPLKSFFTTLALCTSPILAVLGIAFVIVIIALFVSFLGATISFFAGSVGAVVLGIATAISVGSAYGIGGAVMCISAYVFAAALLVLLGALVYKLSIKIFKWTVALFARLVKRNKKAVS